MKRLSVLFIMLVLASWGAMAQDAFKEGVDYELVVPPQPTSEPGKIEVMEFFWYGCPHCLDFEPHLNTWLGQKPKDVLFIRQPAVFNEQWAAHARAYFVAETLGLADKLHADFYSAIQTKRQDPKRAPLISEEEQLKFFTGHGVSEDDFRKAYHSFAVDTKMRQAQTMGPGYGVTGTPTVVVNGKYRLTGHLAKTYPNLIAILNFLIDKERAAVKAKH
ncbi:MAG: thiol:disulfide interchange protein DsbA/DsbL [Methylococcaceae bacterium]|nr:MAG: thiol:disulfide interchange protein DsbA/DsbL [Methylococcaceae bacterium]